MTTASNDIYVYSGAEKAASTPCRRALTNGKRAAGRPFCGRQMIHPNDPEVIYTGTQDGPYRSANPGNSWERLDYPKTGAPPWTFMFRPVDQSLMYLGTALGEIYRSTNDGAPSPS